TFSIVINNLHSILPYPTRHSSDLAAAHRATHVGVPQRPRVGVERLRGAGVVARRAEIGGPARFLARRAQLRGRGVPAGAGRRVEIGRASCRGRELVWGGGGVVRDE